MIDALGQLTAGSTHGSLGLPALAQSAMQNFWFGPDHAPNSALGRDTDALFIFIAWVCLISFALLMVLMVFFVFKFKRGGKGYRVSAAHNTPLELAWSIIPLLVMVVIFFWGFQGYVKKLASTSGAEEIKIIGQQWFWSVQYANGGTPRDFKRIGMIDEAPVIVVPVGRQVKLLLTSKDVIHSFYIPAMRTKIDVFPNRYTGMTFTAEEAGKEHPVYCAEYCGDQHSEMAAIIKTVTAEEYTEYLAKIVGPDPAWNSVQRGEFYSKRFGCTACHTVTGKASTGPTWLNMYGYEQPLEGGGTALADENYIRESIYDPQKMIHQGYGPRSQMSSFQGIIGLEQLNDLIDYMKTKSDKGGVAPSPNAAPKGAAPPADAPADADR
ncbi:MAG: cytochrome c oxidase subunit II [Phycisphaerales bacterium]|nr:cytochrome c oxidase subunit II [Phycisphaerales bacterium]